MNGRVIFSVFAALAIGLSSCTERGQDLEIAPKEHFVFKATIEGSDQTKTTLGEYHDDGTTRSVLWEPMDSIGISCDQWYGFDLFVNRNECTNGIAVFEGETSAGNIHYALYPFSHEVEYYYDNYANQREYHLNLPQKQIYTENSFSRKSFPMVGKKYAGDEEFSFKNLCGVLVVQLTGSETIKSITFSSLDSEGNPMPISGHARVNLNYDEIPTLVIDPNVYNKYPVYENVTLVCNEGITLDPYTPTPFYIVLPAGTYHAPQLIISTESGRMMLKESNNPLTIQRSRSAKVTPMTFTETIPVNLSERGTSNSYIVSESGIYSFDASVIGNGSAGILEDANFHTTNPDITPSKVELLWEDKEGLISGLSYNSTSKSARFMTSGQEGNAVVVAKDENGTIIWSWHIWCTDKPVEHTYINYTGNNFQVMDRNIGATRADRGTGEEWRDAAGLVYQWGRKDPFAYNKDMVASFRFSIEQSIQYPQHISHNHMWLVDGNTSAQLWGATKTIYDPCPVGYKVAPKDTWTGFTTTGQGATHPSEPRWELPWDKGVYFTYDGTNKAWYPASYCGWFYVYISENESECWASDINGYWTDGGQAYRLYIRYGGEMDVNVQPQSILELGGARPVRCVADNNYVDPTLPTVSKVVISSITAKGASAKVSVTSSGSSSVTAKGVVWSTEPNPTIELSTKTENGTGSGDYTAVLTGLNDFTKYYVRSYATNSYGTAYGPEVEFSTKFGGEATDLSSTESANSYIVNEPATFYKFKAVKGNSSQTLENAFYASVVWESFGTNIKPLTGDLIEKAVYQDGYIVFKTSSTSKEGNALIAAKDSEGTILWSWHIWVTDTPAEHTYANGLAVLMDRNLGAVSATPGDVQALGLLYQWGRKDPFLGSSSTTEAIEAASTIIWPASQFYTTHGNIEYVTSHPTTYIRSLDYNNENDWYYGHNTTLWGEDKTIYDPCPVGWKVASMGDAKNPWSNDNFLSLPPFDNANHGYLITLKSGEQAWYPLAGDRYVHGVLESINHRGIIWSSNGLSETTGNSFAYWSDGGINPYGLQEWKARACAIRCQKIQ